MRRILSATLVLILTAGVLSPALPLHAAEINITIDGWAIEFEEVQPINVDGRTLVRMFDIASRLGLSQWGQSYYAQDATMFGSTAAILIIAGRDTFLINDQAFHLDVPAQFVEYEMMIPIRAVMEGLGHLVEWDNATNTIAITTTPYTGDYVIIGGRQVSTSLPVLHLNRLGLDDDDIAALQYMENLIRLELTDNNITDLTPLTGLTSLTTLHIDRNQINDLTPLASLTNLTWLFMGGNQVTNFEPLFGLENLTWLNLASSGISDIEQLAELTSLTRLILHVNEISDISPLSNLTNLNSLWLSSNQISDISPLAGLTNLQDLSLHTNQITDISPLAGLTGLISLDLDRNPLDDISIATIEYFANLELLSLGNIGISDLTPLAGLVNLIDLFLHGNQISDIAPLAGLNLKWLDLTDNPVADWSYVDHIEEVEGRP